jgi:hypothetical protein
VTKSLRNFIHYQESYYESNYLIDEEITSIKKEMRRVGSLCAGNNQRINKIHTTISCVRNKKKKTEANRK